MSDKPTFDQACIVKLEDQYKTALRKKQVPHGAWFLMKHNVASKRINKTLISVPELMGMTPEEESKFHLGVGEKIEKYFETNSRVCTRKKGNTWLFAFACATPGWNDEMATTRGFDRLIGPEHKEFFSFNLKPLWRSPIGPPKPKDPPTVASAVVKTLEFDILDQTKSADVQRKRPPTQQESPSAKKQKMSKEHEGIMTIFPKFFGPILKKVGADAKSCGP